MTQTEWLELNKPLTMLGYLMDRAQDYPGRKFRLFACGCVRSLCGVLPHRRVRDAMRVAERYADGTATRRDLERARRAAQEMAISAWRFGHDRPPMRCAQAAVDLTGENDVLAAWEVCQGTCTGLDEEETAFRCALLRELFGNPFRPPVLPEGWQRWNDGILDRLAWEIAEDQRWADLPVLGDALEEAGCRDDEILQHCRAGMKHVRGCWVVDLFRAGA